MRSKHSYIIFYLLSLYCYIGANAERPAVKACQAITKNSKSSVGNYIVNGQKAKRGEFPFMVALMAEIKGENIFYCGGSLIWPTYVLTAAHCLDGDVSNATIITRFGSLNVGNTTFNPNTDMRVAEKIPHPKYSSSQYYYDIALLRLPNAVNITPNVIPICLGISEEDPKGQLIVAGWGRIDNDGPPSKALLKAYVKAVPLAICKESYKGPIMELPEGLKKGQLCANDPTGQRQDTCQGDSGGPLIFVLKNGQRRLVGVTSFGKYCGYRTPAIYTRVASFLNWIEGTVWSK